MSHGEVPSPRHRVVPCVDGWRSASALTSPTAARAKHSSVRRGHGAVRRLSPDRIVAYETPADRIRGFVAAKGAIEPMISTSVEVVEGSPAVGRRVAFSATDATRNVCGIMPEAADGTVGKGGSREDVSTQARRGDLALL